MRRFSLLHYLLWFLMFRCVTLHASIQLDRTRIIYPASKSEVTLGLTNHSTSPRLIQAWIDEDDTHISVSKDQIPFIVTPPIFRLDAGKAQRVRVVLTDRHLPSDRESMFWLNVLEVRPKSPVKSDDTNTVRVSVRTRIKIFYRPHGLPGTPADAVHQLRWQLVKQNGSFALECSNPGVFNVSFNHVGFSNATVSPGNKQSGMCPARGKKRFSVQGTPNHAEGKLTLISINDFGGNETITSPFLP